MNVYIDPEIVRQQAEDMRMASIMASIRDKLKDGTPQCDTMELCQWQASRLENTQIILRGVREDYEDLKLTACQNEEEASTNEKEACANETSLKLAADEARAQRATALVANKKLRAQRRWLGLFAVVLLLVTNAVSVCGLWNDVLYGVYEVGSTVVGFCSLFSDLVSFSYVSVPLLAVAGVAGVYYLKCKLATLASPSKASPSKAPVVDRVQLRAALHKFYQTWKPEMLVNPEKLNAILIKYQGNEESLFSGLERKYGTRPAFKLPVDPALFVGALVQFYRKHKSSQLENPDTIPDICKRYAGQEEVLYAKLQAKYGEVPRYKLA